MSNTSVDIQAVNPLDWEEANNWAQVFAPHISYPHLPEYVVEEIRQEMSCSRATVFSRYKTYKQYKTVSSMLRRKSGPKTGHSYLHSDVEQIITKNLAHYKTRQKLSAKTVWERIAVDCEQKGIPEPSYATVLRRIRKISRKSRLSSREGSKVYATKHAKVSGHLTADYPLQKVQMDHTLCDLNIVNTRTREVIGRPWLTAMIDVHTRMILGFHFDLTHPSTWTVSEILTQAVFPKDQWLKHHKINMEWPVYGLPKVLMLDNAREFHSKAITVGAGEYGIELDYRPIGKPQFGGHIERVFGTFNNKIHELPGTTFSNVSERGAYESEARAVFTLSELTHFFAVYLLGRYHKTIHRSLGMSPIDKWQEAINTGYAPRACTQNASKFRVDFIKSETRAVTTKGIEFRKNFYWSEVTQGLYDLGVKNVKVYPFYNDISRVMIRSSEGNIFIVPNSDFNVAPISWPEFKAVDKLARKHSKSGLRGKDLAEQVHRERKLVQNSQKLTKAARKKNEIDLHRSNHPLNSIPTEVTATQHNGDVSVPLNFKKLTVLGEQND